MCHPERGLLRFPASPFSENEKTVNANASNAAALPLFYRSPLLLRSSDHPRAGLRRSADFGFAAAEVAIPVVAGEFVQAGRHYPIVFANDAGAMPLAVTGVTQGRNLFVSSEGRWQEGTYLPAYVRRYPFIGITAEANGPVMLGVDGGSPRFLADVEDQEADLFFERDGKATPLSLSALSICEAYAADHLRTRAFVEALVAQGLLVEKSVQIQYNPVASGGAGDAASTVPLQAQVGGFRLVDEAVFRKLPAAVIAEFHAQGWLDLIVLHLASQASWQNLVNASAPAKANAAA
jgi:hypothetical protein